MGLARTVCSVPTEPVNDDQIATTCLPAPSSELGLYVVEVDLRSLTPRGMSAAHRALADAARRVGSSVAYVRSAYAPREGRLFAVFRARGPAVVRTAAEVAQLPGARVLTVIDLTDDIGADGKRADLEGSWTT